MMMTTMKRKSGAFQTRQKKARTRERKKRETREYDAIVQLFFIPFEWNSKTRKYELKMAHWRWSLRTSVGR